MRDATPAPAELPLRDVCERIVRDAMPATDSGATCFVPRYQIDQLRTAVAASLAAHGRVEVTGLLQEARDQIQRLAGGFAEPDSLIRRIDAALEKTP